MVGGGGGAHECCMSHVIPQYNMWHIWWRVGQGAQNKVSKILEQHERQKFRCTAKILLTFLATVKLGRRSIEDKYELVLSEGGKQIFGLSLRLKLQNRQKMRFLCRPTLSRQKQRQRQAAANRISPFLIICITVTTKNLFFFTSSFVLF